MAVSGTGDGPNPYVGKCKGELSWAQEALAAVTLGLIVGSSYLLLALLGLASIVIVWLPAWRTAAVTLVGLLVGSVFIPLEYRPRDWFLGCKLFDLWKDYFYFEYHCHVPDPSKQYIFAEFPHGVFPLGTFLSGSIVQPVFKEAKISGVGADIIFKIPVVRHIWSWMGTRPATRRHIADIFREKHSCAIIVGGIAEMFMVGGPTERVYLKKRKGFVKIAIQQGVAIVPVYSFGTTSCLSTPARGSVLAEVSRRMRSSLILFYGRFFLPIPYRNRIKFVTGMPIPVQQADEPTDEYVDQVHLEFIKALQELYDTHRPEWETRPLSIE